MKNPAVLLYTSDFLTGTIFMSNEEVGAYIRILCMQHQKGHLSEKDMKKICNSNEVFSQLKMHFKKDENGNFFNERMEIEIEKRSKFVESRTNNRKKIDNQNTCVYLMINKTNNLIKIGSSNNPERRLLEVKKYYKENQIELYAYCENKPQTLEKELHEKYKDKWCFDEWYDLNKNEIDNIINTNDMKLHMNNHMINDMNNHMENENENENINENINENKNENINKNINKKEKHKYGEYKHVLLSDDEYEKLKQNFSNYLELIKFLDEYIEMKGYKAKNHYLAIHKWVVKAVEEEKIRNKKIEESGSKKTFNPFLEMLREENEKNEQKRNTYDAVYSESSIS